MSIHTLKVSQVPISVECLFSMTLLIGGAPEYSKQEIEVAQQMTQLQWDTAVGTADSDSAYMFIRVFSRIYGRVRHVSAPPKLFLSLKPKIRPSAPTKIAHVKPKSGRV